MATQWPATQAPCGQKNHNNTTLSVPLPATQDPVCKT